MTQEYKQSLAKVSNKRELVEELTRMNESPKISTVSPKSKKQAQPKTQKVKTYMLEANKLFESNKGNKVTWEIKDGGMPMIKILHIHSNDNPEQKHRFYLDKTNKRFLLLHTNENAVHANSMIRSLVGERNYSFDHAWFYSDMLQKWSKEMNDKNGKYFINHAGTLQKNRLKMSIEGDNSGDLYDKLAGMEEFQGCISHELIEVKRKEELSSKYIKEHITNNGCFAIQRGKSIQEHLEVVTEV